MPLLGSGFNPASPADTDPVSEGAAQIRDLKSRLQSFVSVYFDPNTGAPARTQFRVTLSATQPLNPEFGDVYYDTVLGKAFIYLPSGWTEFAPATPPTPGVFTAQFLSANQTVVAAGSLTLAHGLGSLPTLVSAELVNTISQFNYNPGDVVPISLDNQQTSGFAIGLAVVPDATNIFVRFGAFAASITQQAISILNKTTGSPDLIDPAKWVIRFRAWK